MHNLKNPIKNQEPTATIMTTNRPPAVAGQFYAGTPKQLTQQLTTCFQDTRGPGTLPTPDTQQPPLKALIVPHAGYQFSGPIAAHAYHKLATHGFADTFIIIGPNHTGIGAPISIMTEGTWETPLGKIPINTTLAKQLAENLTTDDTAHTYEHSLEVQLPFLQFIAPQQHPYTIIPICMMHQNIQTATTLGTQLATHIKQHSAHTVIIASTDFSHVGFNYNTMPPNNQTAAQYAQTQDHKAIEHINNLDPTGLIQTVQKHHISMCGYGPVAATLTAAKQLNATQATLLKYGTSYEVHPSTSCVGYGSYIIY